MDTAHYIQELNATNSHTPKFSFTGHKVLARCVDVYDGDTAHFTFRVYPGAPMAKYSVRFMGYNSAEIKGSGPEEKHAALEAKNALKNLIEGKLVNLHLYDFDKYGRPLADVYVASGAIATTAEGLLVEPLLHVNNFMLENHFGAAYVGKGEKKWK